MFDSIGSESADSEVLSAQLDGLRHQIAEALAVNGSKPSIDEVRNNDCTTTIRASLFKAWAHAARDPAECICEWLVSGAPAGLNRDFNQLDTLFPRVDPTEKEDPEGLFTEHDEFVNYHGVEEDDDARDLIATYVKKEYLK